MGRASHHGEAAWAAGGGHPTLVIPVHLSFSSDSFHFSARNLPGVFYNIMTKIWSCWQLPWTKNLLIRKPEMALSMEMSLMCSGNGNKVSLNLPASGVRPPTSVYDALSPTARSGTILHPRQGCCRSLLEPCNLLPPAPASETFPVQTCPTQQPPSWTASCLSASLPLPPKS